MYDMLPPLILAIRANAEQVYSEFGKVATASKKLDSDTSGGMKHLAGAGKAITLGLAGAALTVGAASLKMGMDFQESTTQLVTGAGESEKNIGMVRNGLIAMAPAVGMGPEALAKAMFLVESAGFHGAAGLQVMKAAAEGAKIGGADATTVANGLTTALTDYKLPATDAANVTSQLVATVAAGKTNMQDLSDSLSAVLPSASAAHIGLNQVLGALGTMTGEGISAQQASQDLASTIRSLGNPSDVASKAMAQMGLNSITVARNLGKEGLTGTLGELTTAITSHMGPAGLVLQSSFNQSKLAAQSANQMLSQLPPSLQALGKGYLAGTVTQKEWMAQLKTQPAMTANLARQFATAAKESQGFSDSLKSGSGPAKTFNAMLSDMTGGATGLDTSLALTGSNMGTFTSNTSAIGKATAEAGGHVKGWADTSKDLSTQLAQAKAGIEAMGTKLGMMLIPYVETAIRIGTQWTNYLMKHKDVMIAVAAVIGGVLLTAITAYVAGLAVAAVENLTAFATMVGGWLGVGAAAETAGAATTLAMGPIVLGVAAVAIAAYELYKHWNQVWGFIKTISKDVWGYLRPIFSAIVQVGLWPIRQEINLFRTVWSAVWGGVSSVLSGVWNGVIGPVFGSSTPTASPRRSRPCTCSARSGPPSGRELAQRSPGCGTTSSSRSCRRSKARYLPCPLRSHRSRTSHRPPGTSRRASGGITPLGPAGSAGRGGDTYIIQVSVAGSVLSENELGKTVERVMLEKGVRRGKTYVPARR